MKRALLCLVVLGVASALGGCPIYPSSQNDYRVCDGVGCFDCPDPVYSSMCVPWSCNTDGDCDPRYSCIGGQCVTPGAAPTDCSQTGCPAGQVCRLSGGIASCVSVLENAPGGSATDATAPEDASLAGDALPTVDAALGDAVAQDAAISDATGVRDAIGDAPSDADAGSPTDASDAVASPDVASVPCNANAACGSAARCIDGQCTPIAQLCSDGTQCVTSGEACVDGVCTPQCSASIPCPAGYGCDFQAGVCALNPGACSGSCPGGAVCVESRCVPPCGAGVLGSASDTGACPSGQVCVNGGCIPDERAQFSCRNDGASGQLANACDPASVCLHHSCYVACDGDGGGCPASSCKQVTVTAGTYAVCATPSTLGSQCDLAAGNPCNGTQICVDGYCKN